MNQTFLAWSILWKTPYPFEQRVRLSIWLYFGLCGFCLIVPGITYPVAYWTEETAPYTLTGQSYEHVYILHSYRG